MAAWCALNPLALLLEMVSQPDGIGSKPLAIENSQVKRLHQTSLVVCPSRGGVPQPPAAAATPSPALQAFAARSAAGPAGST